MSTKKIFFIFFFVSIIAPIKNQIIPISTCLDLQNINVNNNTVIYNITTNIDCSSMSFLPIGNVSNPFKGTLLGNSYNISYINIQNGSIDNVGLFSFGYYATVQDLNFVSSTVNGSNNVGMIFGQSTGSNISNILLYNVSSHGNSSIGSMTGYSSNEFISTTYFVNSIVTSTGFLSTGGLIGICHNCTISKSGINSGTVTSNGECGGLVGTLGSNSYVSSSYVTDQVNLLSSQSNPPYNIIGGLFGLITQTNSTNGTIIILNCYCSANISALPSSSYVGGIIGRSVLFGLSINISQVYSTSSVFGNSIIGNILGQTVNTGGNLSLNQCYYNFQLNSYLGFGSGSTTDGTSPLSFNCSSLYIQILSSYPQNIWSGIQLSSQYQFISTGCNCSSGCPSTTTTNTPTLTSTSTITNTLSPTPTTIFSTSVNLQTSTVQNTITPTNTVDPICLFNVLNCQNCNNNVNMTIPFGLNVSCILFENKWQYTFYNQSSNSIFNSQTITVNGTTIYFQGNFTQTQNGTLVFIISTLQNNTNNNILFVEGCIKIDGKIVIILDKRPASSNTTVPIIYYNCSASNSNVTLSNNQIRLVPTYKNNKCDQIDPSLDTFSNSIYVSFHSSPNQKCNKNYLAIILSLSIGIPIFMFIFTVTLIKCLRYINNKSSKKALNEMNKLKLANYNHNDISFEPFQEIDKQISSEIDTNTNNEQSKTKNITWNENQIHQTNTIWTENKN